MTDYKCLRDIKGRLLGNILYLILKEKDISCEDFGKLIGYSENEVKDYLLFPRNSLWDIRKVNVVSEALDIDPYLLLWHQYEFTREKYYNTFGNKKENK